MMCYAKKKKKSIWSAIVREHAIGTSLFNETHGCLSSSLASPSPPKALVLYWTFSTSCLWLCPTDKKSFCFLYRKSIFLFLFLSLYCKRFRHSHFLVAVDPYALEAIYIYNIILLYLAVMASLTVRFSYFLCSVVAKWKFLSWLTQFTSLGCHLKKMLLIVFELTQVCHL